MKYFTSDWCFGKLSDKEMNRIYEDYSKYIDSIYKQLPCTLKILSKNLSLHDGLVNEVILYSQSKELIIKCICGDLSFGYFKLTIKYLNVNNFDSINVKDSFNNKPIEILYDEIELFENKSYSHRIIFNNEGEIEIKFNDLEFNITNEIFNNYTKKNCLVKIFDKKPCL